MNEKQGYVYIMTNKVNTVLYTGVTSNLVKRVYEHKNKLVPSFTNNYNVNKLVYYEVSPSILSAIEREKEIKGKKRAYKESLINEFNPEWKDLYENIIQFKGFFGLSPQNDNNTSL